MLEELRGPAPSTIFLATGVRPVPDPGLKVHTHESHRVLQLRTSSFQITVDRPAGTLTLLNLKTHATWTLAETNPRVEMLTPTMARITLARPAPVMVHVDGSAPCFGLGERFFQSALTNTHFDVRPADRSGEPGHNWSYVAVPLVYTPTGLGLFVDTVFDTNFSFNAAGSAFDLRVATYARNHVLLHRAEPEVDTGTVHWPHRPPADRRRYGPLDPGSTPCREKTPSWRLAQRIRSEGIPASALWVFDELDEPDNLGWPFWFSSYYGDPAPLTITLHSQGFKVLGYVHPYVREKMLPYPSPKPCLPEGSRRAPAGRRRRRPARTGPPLSRCAPATSTSPTRAPSIGGRPCLPTLCATRVGMVGWKTLANT